MDQIFLETRMFRLSEGEEIMTLPFFVLIQYRSVTDGQTDKQTDGHLCSGYTSACIARYANALVTNHIGEHCVQVSSNSDKNCRRRSILQENYDVTIMTSSGHVTSSGVCAIDSP